MPITSTFDPKNYGDSVETLLTEFLRDFYPSADYVITFEAPPEPKKRTLWLQRVPGASREILRTPDGKSGWKQGKEVRFLVSALAKERSDAKAMADRFENAVLASASNLGTAGLRYARVTGFEEIPEFGQQSTFRRVGSLAFTVELKA